MVKKKSRSKKKAKKYHIELTTPAVILWGCCFFFVLVWIFVLGILVGRGFLPGAVTAISDLKDQIRKFQSIVGAENSPDVKSPKKPKPDLKLDFYNKLSSKKNEAKKKGRPEKKVRTSKKESPTQRIADSPPQSPQEPKKRKSIVVPKRKLEPLIPKPRFTVQLASLEDRKKAEEMVWQLKRRGLPAYYYEVTLRGKAYFRIRCGRFFTRKDAAAYAGRLKRKERLEGFVSRLD